MGYSWFPQHAIRINNSCQSFTEWTAQSVCFNWFPERPMGIYSCQSFRLDCSEFGFQWVSWMCNGNQQFLSKFHRLDCSEFGLLWVSWTCNGNQLLLKSIVWTAQNLGCSWFPERAMGINSCRSSNGRYLAIRVFSEQVSVIRPCLQRRDERKNKLKDATEGYKAAQAHRIFICIMDFSFYTEIKHPCTGCWWR